MSSKPNRSKPKLLCVDDEPDVLDLLGLAFGEDYEVVTAGDATEALQVLERAPGIRLAIVDFMMPGCDGLTLVRSFRERGYAMPVILYSGYVDSLPEEYVGALRLKVIAKIEPLEDLKDAVREMIAAASGAR
jgi:CheY-like chemotaxis protein